MVEIKTELFAEPKEGQTYVIEKAGMKQVKTSNKTYDAIGVEMHSTDKLDKNLYSLTLWMQDTASSNSKLGSFLVALGNNTESWVGKTIRVRTWRNKEREIEVLS